jgi:hypothetical protein
MLRKYIILSALAIASVPFWLWGAWLATPKKKMVVAIVDKSEYQKEGREHMSLTWVLNNERYTKTHKKEYSISGDYFGFHPKKKSEYKINGLERFSSMQLDQLSNDCDIAYYADTYGVYTHNLQNQKSSTNNPEIVYGGMSQQDINFLKRVKSRKKLIISEYSLLQPPTSTDIRRQYENMFGLKWSGWACKYFYSLDTLENKEIPSWIVDGYKARNSGKWPFKNAGLTFVGSSNEVVILEDYKHLNDALPYIRREPDAPKYIDLTDDIKFPFWFDIVIADTTINAVAARFDIDLTNEGKEELMRHQIPLFAPAVTTYKGKDYRFYYFSGSFSSLNKLSISSSHFKWVSAFKTFLYNEDDALESASFFWNFYRPLLTSILRHHYQNNSHLGK